MKRKFVAAVRVRARNRCEYCQYPQIDCGATFHCDHCIPESQGGPTTFDNLGWSCPHCNGSKLAYTHDLDPTTKTAVRLFNPRGDSWDDHFAWSPDGARIIGLTPTGRATVRRLKINDPRWPRIRATLLAQGAHPMLKP